MSYKTLWLKIPEPRKPQGEAHVISGTLEKSMQNMLMVRYKSNGRVRERCMWCPGALGRGSWGSTDDPWVRRWRPRGGTQRHSGSRRLGSSHFDSSTFGSKNFGRSRPRSCQAWLEPRWLRPDAMSYQIALGFGLIVGHVPPGCVESSWILALF